MKLGVDEGLPAKAINSYLCSLGGLSSQTSSLLP